ncbi:MAG: hypothetical protein WCS03_04030 [Bacteroidota bacterium]
MKKIKLLLIVVFLLAAGSSFQQAIAQEKTKAEQEKEQQILKAIEEQKKAMADQKQAQAESEQSLKKQKSERDENLKEIQVEVTSSDEGGDVIKYFSPRGNRSYPFTEPFIISDKDMQGFYGHGMGGDSEKTTWDFSKSVKETTFSKEYSFDVEKTVNTVVMSVMGDCKTGEIRIKIVMPSAKNYSDIVIDESGNLNWRKSFTVSETENQDKTGEWKFKIDSNKATGFFKISLQTY